MVCTEMDVSIWPKPVWRTLAFETDNRFYEKTLISATCSMNPSTSTTHPHTNTPLTPLTNHRLKQSQGTEKSYKLISALQHLPYSDRLKACGLTTLNFRRIRGDIIETYKILSRKYDADVPFMNNACTFIIRGNDMRLQKV